MLHIGESVAAEEQCPWGIYLLAGRELALCLKGRCYFMLLGFFFFFQANTTLRNDLGDEQSKPYNLGKPSKTRRRRKKPERGLSTNNFQTQNKMTEVN